MAGETVTYSLESVLTRIEGKIDSFEKRVNERFDKVDERFDRLDERLTKLEIGQADLKGDVKALDKKINGLTARVAYQEFTNRGILIALVVALIGGAAKVFGFIGNP
jgi:predicted RNase H-like nuclease (RuvC/YqgF family)